MEVRVLDREPVRLRLVVASPEVAPDRRFRPLAVALVAMGGAIAATSLLGPLLLGAIDYHVAAGVADQIIGADAVALALIAPLALVAGVLAWRGNRRAPLLALGPALFAVYTYVQVGSGGDPALHPGNSEMYFALHLGLIVLSGGIAIRAWSMVSADALPAMTTRAFRFLGWMMIGAAGFLAIGLHLPHLLQVWGDRAADLPSYVEDPQVFWLVKVMDLAVVVPALVAIGVGSLRRRRWAHKAVYGSVGALALLASSVAAMAVAMQLGDDPEASMLDLAAFLAIAAGFAFMAIRLYLPALRAGAVGTETTERGEPA